MKVAIVSAALLAGLASATAVDVERRQQSYVFELLILFLGPGSVLVISCCSLDMATLREIT